MSKKTVKWLTDTACDIPTDIAQELGIEIRPFSLLVDGTEHLDSDFTAEEYFDVLLSAKELPLTSRIRSDEFFDCYRRAAEEGYQNLVHITISSTGSGTYESALMARNQFMEEYPDSQMTIHIIDSRSYSFVYGHALVEGARRINGGEPLEDVLDYIRDWIDSAEVYLACYSLEFAKRSGRINSTAAFVGEMLGLRPIIQMIDGGNKVIDKVRGDRNLVPRLSERAAKAIEPNGEYYIMHGMLEEPCREFIETMTGLIGYPPLGVYPLGPAITTNAGPRSVGIILRGKKRN